MPTRQEMLESKRINRMSLFLKIATEKGGKLLSTTSTGSKGFLSFQCKHGHEFALREDTFRDGKWCSKCSYEKMAEKKRDVLKDVMKLEDFEDQIHSSGDVILKAEGRGAATQLEILCKNGHTRKTTLLRIKQKRSCLTCFLEEIATKRKSKIQAYINKQEFTLLSVVEKNKQKLSLSCSQGHKFTRFDSDKTPYCMTCRRLIREDFLKHALQETAAERGDVYLGLKTPLRNINSHSSFLFSCSKNHVFSRCVSDYLDGGRCAHPNCFIAFKSPYGNIDVLNPNRKYKYTVGDVLVACRKHGGKCLSDLGEELEPVKSKKKITLRCLSGHEWTTSVRHIVHEGTWCNECAIEESRLGGNSREVRLGLAKSIPHKSDVSKSIKNVVAVLKGIQTVAATHPDYASQIGLAQ